MEANLQRLKEDFADELNSGRFINEFDLLRGLQGHNNDYEYVKKLMRAHMRLMACVDWSKFQRHPIMRAHYSYAILGDTGKNDDTFVCIEPAGRIDADGILKSVSITSLMLNRLLDIENAMRVLRAYENDHKRQAKILFIFDLEGFELDATWISILNKPFKLISKFFSDQYSEVLEKMVVVNCPTYIYYLWRMVQPLLPEMTRRKVAIYHGEDWKEKLSEHVHPSRLPAHWGGTLMDANGDPMYRTAVTVPPGKVPKEAYYTPSGADPTPEQMKTLAVAAGRCEYLNVMVDEQDLAKGPVYIKWHFTTDGDFSFGVFYADASMAQETDQEKMTMVYPYFELLPGPTQVPERDRVLCEKPGVYKMRFGNDTAWWYNLNVTYYAVIVGSESS